MLKLQFQTEQQNLTEHRSYFSLYGLTLLCKGTLLLYGFLWKTLCAALHDEQYPKAEIVLW